jgi:hypothetical protein
MRRNKAEASGQKKMRWRTAMRWVQLLDQPWDGRSRSHTESFVARRWCI